LHTIPANYSGRFAGRRATLMIEGKINNTMRHPATNCTQSRSNAPLIALKTPTRTPIVDSQFGLHGRRWEESGLVTPEQ
jgi:hypothetical protein